jgi:parallel beta-helix repeat protein
MDRKLFKPGILFLNKTRFIMGSFKLAGLAMAGILLASVLAAPVQGISIPAIKQLQDLLPGYTPSPSIDFMVKDVSVNSPVVRTTPNTLFVTVKSLSNTDVSNVQVRVSTGEGDIYLVAPSIPAWSSVVLNASWVYSQYGNFTGYVEVDPYNMVRERNENNNVKAFAVQVDPLETTASSCEDATSKLNGAWDKVVLNQSVTDHVGTCITFGADNVIFDGGKDQGVVIDGDNDYMWPDFGVDLNGTSGVTVQNADIKEFTWGIYGNGANLVNIVNNHLHHNTDTGIFWANGNNFTVLGNLIEWNTADGLGTAGDTYSNVIQFNTLYSNGVIAGGAYGMNIEMFNSFITDNILYSNAWYGIFVWFPSSGNKIYHNNFIFNNDFGINQARDDGNNNAWDNGYPSGGNYWNHYDSEAEGCFDNNSGASQLQSGPDGICDSPMSQNGLIDNYPFVNQSGWLFNLRD